MYESTTVGIQPAIGAAPVDVVHDLADMERCIAWTWLEMQAGS